MIEGNTSQPLLVRRRKASRGPRTMTRAEALHRDLRGLQIAPQSSGAATESRRKSKPMMYSLEKSDAAIVAVKPANNARQRIAEQMEPRAAAKVNPGGQSMRRAQKRGSMSQAADWIRKQRRGTRRGVPCIECRWPSGIPSRSCRRENPTAGGNDHSTLPARQ